MILSGINVQASQDHLGYKNTALHCSARYGRGDITDLLLSAGSNVNAIDEVILGVRKNSRLAHEISKPFRSIAADH